MRPHAIALLSALSAACLAPAAAQTVLRLPDAAAPRAEAAVLSYSVMGRSTALSPADIFDIASSESGGITDIFIRLRGEAVRALAATAAEAAGGPIEVQVCGAPLLRTTLGAGVTPGTLYIPNTTARQAEALRAVWHGRATCSDIDPEVFPLAQ